MPIPFFQSRTPPPLVSWLGYGGLIPFLALAIGLQASSQWADRLGPWLIGYGAVILSFVGALHWGFAMMIEELASARRQRAYIWSVLPSLIGFVAVMLGPSLGYSLLIVGFALAYWQDADLANHTPVPAWYPRLRARLSVIASVSLLSAILF